RAAEARIAELSAGFGGADLVELETRREQAVRLDSRVDAAAEALEALAAGDPLDALPAHEARIDAAVAELLAARPAWREAPPDARALQEALAPREAAVRT